MLPSNLRLLPCVAAAWLLLPLGASLAQTSPAASGAAYAWGFNGSGQLGNGTTASSSVPVAVNGLGGNVTAVATGAAHNLAVQNGAVYAWGYNYDGQLGNGTTTDSSVPVPVNGLGSSVTAVTAGVYHSVAVQNGAVYAWGYNYDGQLGNSTVLHTSIPVAVDVLTRGVTTVAAGFDHNLAIQNGAAYAWGADSKGELGNNVTADAIAEPVAVSGLGSGVTAIAAGNGYSLAIRAGVIYAWGYNFNGQLGDGTTIDRSAPVAVKGMGGTATSIAAGPAHNLAVANGNVYAWGYNSNGQLGNGTTTDSALAVQVDATDLTNITAVATGENSSYALASDGSLWVWGYNGDGELGLGNTTDQLTPQHLLPPSGYRYSALHSGGLGSSAVAILTPTAPAFFDGQVALSNGVNYLQLPGGNPFGYYSFLSDPHYIYHQDLGYEYVFDARDGQGGVYLYDFASSTFFYTSRTFSFPYLYDFSLNAPLYYYPDPSNFGRYNTNGVRYFYNFNAYEIISK